MAKTEGLKITIDTIGPIRNPRQYNSMMAKLIARMAEKPKPSLPGRRAKVKAANRAKGVKYGSPRRQHVAFTKKVKKSIRNVAWWNKIASAAKEQFKTDLYRWTGVYEGRFYIEGRGSIDSETGIYKDAFYPNRHKFARALVRHDLLTVDQAEAITGYTLMRF